jgi:electron transport complex protein RnfG
MSLPAVAPPTPPSAWKLYRALCGVGLVCGILIVLVFDWTRPIIQRNRIEARQRAIFDVIPGASATAAFRFDGERYVPPASEDEKGLVFAGYGAGGELLGVALEAAAMGYQDTIRVLYGYSFEQQAIVGMRVLESRETPGLGDRIEKDATFLANFARHDVSLDDERQRLRHPIEFVKPGAKQQPWQIDGISGATISSRAIAEMLRDSAAARIPRLHRNRESFESRQ